MSLMKAPALGQYPEVPAPPPWRRFMLYFGPVIMSVALGLGTSEVILYPHLTVRFGTGWLGLMVLALVFQTFWAMELSRWTLAAGEHGGQHNGRALGPALAGVFVTGFMFLAFALPAWATAAASALRQILGWPADVRSGTVFWAYITFVAAFALVFFSRVAREYVEKVAFWTTLAAWALLLAGAIMGLQWSSIKDMAYHLFVWDIPKDMDWWVLGSTLAWAGAGPTLLWYTYWMRDAGWGMAKYAGSIPGWLGGPVAVEPVGGIPRESPENSRRLRQWLARSRFVLWVGYFLGSLFTIFIFIGLSDSILRPAGLCPSGFEVVKHQALFFSHSLGKAGIVAFLLMAWLFFFNTQLTVAEALVRQNTEASWSLSVKIRRFFGADIRKLYFFWWAVYLAVSFVLIGVQYFVPKADPFRYVTLAAMLSFVSLVFSMAATLWGNLTLYRHPALEAVRPKAWITTVLAIGLVFHLFWIARAVGYFFGFWK